jgi:hypothetical protein
LLVANTLVAVKAVSIKSKVMFGLAFKLQDRPPVTRMDKVSIVKDVCASIISRKFAEPCVAAAVDPYVVLEEKPVENLLGIMSCAYREYVESGVVEDTVSELLLTVIFLPLPRLSAEPLELFHHR